MPSEKILVRKKKQVESLVKELQAAESIVLTDYKGLTVAQDTEMRADFRSQGLSYKVVKNSITSRAFEKLGIEGLAETLTGPTAIAYSSEDVVLAPRLMRKYTEKFKKMSIKGGVVGTEVYPLEKIMALSRIESREGLYGQLLFMMLYPLTAFAQVSAQIVDKGNEAGVETVAELAFGQAVPAAAEVEEAEAPEAEEVKEEENTTDQSEGTDETPASTEEESDNE
ncbi:MAG TPA: 50S ribosomal protein L10 [Clostridiaceae bacterium]|nr:50S ribosomal protein L10 [Clostridiaceae bacterium]